jgi:uncharacterized SAM-binding protein YcdF (DUF218 family)
VVFSLLASLILIGLLLLPFAGLFLVYSRRVDASAALLHATPAAAVAAPDGVMSAIPERPRVTS